MNKELIKWIKIFYSLTFNIEKEFEDIYSYNERLIHFKNVYQVKIKMYRRAFLYAFKNNEKLRRAYADYMNTNFDYILFVNLNVSAPDQRKFDGGDFIPFTAYWYQVVIWELYNRFTLGYWKSRDIGLSFAINAGEAMCLVHEKGDEVFYLSRVESDVDASKDRTQTNMGRIRQIIESSSLYTLDNFYRDSVLNLYSSRKSGIQGKSTSGHPGRGGRAKRSFVDEAGSQKKLGAVMQSVSMSAKNVSYAGTLMPGQDSAFRSVIEEGIRIDAREIFENFYSRYKEYKKEDYFTAYRKAWDKVTEELREKIGEGKAISFTNTFRDHPLKAGNCDYEEIEKNRLLNDPVILAHELYADLDAGSPDRSFYSLLPEHHIDISIKDFHGFPVIMGFDPGTHKTAAMTPIIQDHHGFIYALESEIMPDVSMSEWLERLKLKYGNFLVVAEDSVAAYKKAGGGWTSFLRKAGLKVIQVSNRHMDSQLMVVNELFRAKNFNYETQEMEYKFKISNKNKWYSMSYQYGMKHSGDAEQRRMSHPAESLIAALYHLNKDVISMKKEKPSFGHY